MILIFSLYLVRPANVHQFIYADSSTNHLFTPQMIFLFYDRFRFDANYKAALLSHPCGTGFSVKLSMLNHTFGGNLDFLENTRKNESNCTKQW